jgi:hypothetical protein
MRFELSKREIARRVGKSHVSVIRWSNGKTRLSAATVAAIRKVVEDEARRATFESIGRDAVEAAAHGDDDGGLCLEQVEGQ